MLIFLLSSIVEKSIETSKQLKSDQLNGGKKSTDNSVSGDEHSSTDEKDSNKEKEDEKKEDQDVVFVQDVGFTIKIMAPGVEPFDIQVLTEVVCSLICINCVQCLLRFPAWKWSKKSISS